MQVLPSYKNPGDDDLINLNHTSYTVHELIRYENQRLAYHMHSNQ